MSTEGNIKIAGIMLGVLLMAVLLLSTVSATAFSEEDPPVFMVKTTDAIPSDLWYQVTAEPQGGKNGAVQVYCDYGKQIFCEVAEGPLTIPNSVSYQGKTYDVTAIDGHALSGKGMTEIRLPSTLVSIGKSALSNCESLTNMNIPDSVTELGEYAFGGCPITSIVLPDGVTAISRLFNGCRYLSKVRLPAELTFIGYETFYGCESLTEITLPARVSTLDNHAFRETGNMINIHVDKDNPNFTSIDGVVYNKELTSLVVFPKGKSGEFKNIPDTVTAIGSYALEECKKITGITLPSGLKNIYDGAFSFCENLQNIDIPESVEFIGDVAFWGCESLTSIHIPRNVASIGELGKEDRWFSAGRSIAFCSSLLEITVDDANKKFAGIDGVLYDKELTTLFIYPGGRETFDGAKIPATVTVVEDEAFLGCRKLKNIIFPDTITKVGNESIECCDSLLTVAFPTGLTEIGGNFYWCPSLVSVSFMGQAPPTVMGEYNSQYMNNSFYLNRDLIIYIPTGAGKAYQEADFNNRFHNDYTYKASYVETDFATGALIFSDTPNGRWYTENINAAAGMGWVKGVGNGLFQPERSVTRAEFVQMVLNLLYSSYYGYEANNYTDVNQADWFYDALIMAQGEDLLTGFTGEKFYPNQAIKREEMASILSAVINNNKEDSERELDFYAQLTTPEDHAFWNHGEYAALARDFKEKYDAALSKNLDLAVEFTDYHHISSAYMDDVRIVVSLGLMQGMGDNTFTPQGVSTRAQAATVLVNLGTLLSKTEIRR